MRLTPIDWTALILAIIGALNWGLIGLVGLNLVNAIFGAIPVVENIVYVLVGLAGLWLIYLLVRAGGVVGAPGRTV